MLLQPRLGTKEALGSWQYDIDADAIRVDFSVPHSVLSSAVYGGGLVEAQHFINLKIPPECPFESEGTDPLFHRVIDEQQQKGGVVGMLTAASMRSTRIVEAKVGTEKLWLILTSGLANARRAGDQAEHRQLYDTVDEVGTINILVGTSFPLSTAAQAEMLMIVTEAKAACLQNLKVQSPVSQQVATGTGTDACAIASPVNQNKPEVIFAGKHTLLGEVLAKATMQALESSVKYKEQS